jgi:hypothetical protein
MTNQDLYYIYVAICLDDPTLYLVSNSAFMRIRNQITIRMGNFDFSCFCPWCHKTDDTTVDEDDDDEDVLQSNQEGSRKTKEQHLELIKSQSEAFKKILRSLREGQILLVMDFTSIAVPSGKSQFLYINDLIVTIYEPSGRHDWINYCATSDQKQMFDYVEGSLYDLFSTYLPDTIEKVFVFSDGGPKHSKSTKR